MKNQWVVRIPRVCGVKEKEKEEGVYRYKKIFVMKLFILSVMVDTEIYKFVKIA